MSDSKPDKVPAERRVMSDAERLARRRESRRRWRENNPEKNRASKVRSRQSYGRARAIKDTQRWRAAKVYPDFNTMWEAQDGRCYLCRKPLKPGRGTQMDHDHSCCPSGISCRICRRGLACGGCNTILSRVNDDPDLLHLIADNFAPVLLATRARIAAERRVQDGLF
jgi:hypothetical protein